VKYWVWTRVRFIQISMGFTPSSWIKYFSYEKLERNSKMFKYVFSCNIFHIMQKASSNFRSEALH
jgi:hypothetical protein